MEQKREVLLSIRDLEIKFNDFIAVSDINFDIYKGETFSLVGESGSGKSTIGRAIVGLNKTSKGEILYKGKKINEKMPRHMIKSMIKNIQMIFQDPAASLNERATIDYIISEGLINFHLYKNEAERKKKVIDALTSVGLLPEHATRYPHEFSGGQRQRIGMARAMVMDPELIIADEPISALDVSIRAQVLNLLKKLQVERDLTYLFIAHDLSVVRFISNRIAVIHKGCIVELAEAEELFLNPLHPYTKALLSAIPIPDPRLEKNKELLIYTEEVHDYSKDKPKWIEITSGHFVWANEVEAKAYRKSARIK